MLRRDAQLVAGAEALGAQVSERATPAAQFRRRGPTILDHPKVEGLLVGNREAVLAGLLGAVAHDLDLDGGVGGVRV